MDPLARFSLKGLRAVETAGRLRSVTRAAAALGVSAGRSANLSSRPSAASAALADPPLWPHDAEAVQVVAPSIVIAAVTELAI